MYPHKKARCPNCDTATDNFRQLNEVEDLAVKLSNRVGIGGEVPAGECLACGSFVYSTDVDRVSKAMAELQRDYYDDVRGMVEMVKEEIKAGTFSTRDEVLEYVHESCDGAQRVIYTQQAKICLLVSENEDAYFEEFGGESPKDVSVLAFCAFYRDVMDRLDIPECDECGDLATVEGPCGEELCKDCAEAILEDEEESDDE